MGCRCTRRPALAAAAAISGAECSIHSNDSGSFSSRCLARTARTSAGGHRSAVAGARPGVVREPGPDGHEQHERAMLLGAGALPWLGVAVGVNPLNNLFIIHNG